MTLKGFDKGNKIMPFSNYPAGFSNGIIIRNVPLLQSYPGQVFWVGNGNGAPVQGEKGESDGNTGTFLAPFATIVKAMTAVVAGRGDIIVVKPGHTETCTAAAHLVVKANTAIVGLGAGSYRCTFNFTTVVGASVSFAGAGASVTNCLFTGGLDALTGPISVSAADVTIENCEFRDVTGQATDAILTTAAADRLLVRNYFHNGADAAGANAAIAIVGGDAITLKDLKISGNFAVGAIDIRTTATTKLVVRDALIKTFHANDIAIIDTITASTGWIGPNLFLQLKDNAANITEAVTGATFVSFDPIYVVNLAGEKAMLINTTASTDA